MRGPDAALWALPEVTPPPLPWTGPETCPHLGLETVVPLIGWLMDLLFLWRFNQENNESFHDFLFFLSPSNCSFPDARRCAEFELHLQALFRASSKN